MARISGLTTMKTATGLVNLSRTTRTFRKALFGSAVKTRGMIQDAW